MQTLTPRSGATRGGRGPLAPVPVDKFQ